jgi:selenocysteine lyase/cysteine desulfurase
MFEPLDPESALDRSRRITDRYVSDALQGYVDADIIADDERQAVLALLHPLFDLIRESPKGEEFWRAFKRHFGFHSARPRIVPMNAANLCPEPEPLIAAANLLRIAYNRNVAQQVRTAGGARVAQLENVRIRLAGSLGLPPERKNDLALIRNSSEGNNAIHCGFRDWTRTSDLAQLDTVVVWDDNHPTNLDAWRLRRDPARRPRNDREKPDTPQEGDLFELIPVKLDRLDNSDQIARAFIRRIDKRTRFVTFSETSNGSGMRIPEKAIEDIWRHVASSAHRDCHVHIDGTMSWGARPVDLSRAHCHSFVSSAHKWFMGPKETAVFYMRKDRAVRFTPSIHAYDYQIKVPAWDKLPDDALRFELLGQRDDVNLITLDLTQMMWDLLAAHQPYARVTHLADSMKRQLLNSRWRLKTPESAETSAGIVRVEAPKKNHRESPSLYDWMYDPAREHRFGGSGGSEAPGEQTFRLCPHLYNTEEDIDRAVASMNAWRTQHGA